MRNSDQPMRGTSRLGGKGLLLRSLPADGVLGIGVLCVVLMSWLAWRYPHFDWDVAIALWIQSIDWPGFGILMWVVSEIGRGWVPYLLTPLIGLSLIWGRYRAEGAVLMIGAAAGAVVNRVLKYWIARPRPGDGLLRISGIFPHESFPSGHAMFFTECFGFLLFLALILLPRGRGRTVICAFLGGLIASVGVSRIWLGAHWPSDVLGGYVIGGLLLLLMVELYRRWPTRGRRGAGSPG